MEMKAIKRFGQNFLMNEAVCKKIVSFLKCSNDANLLEIGPGHGAITKYLTKKYNNLTCVELDFNLADELKTTYPTLNIIQGNFLKLDISSYEAITGNIPYNITTEILVKIVKEAKNCKEIELMIQKEAFDRIVVANKQEEVTPLSIILKTFYTYEENLFVSKEEFNPKPNVDSIVFSLYRNDLYKDFNIKKYYTYLLICFSSRRKNIFNNLIKNYNKDKVLSTLEKLGIDRSERSEKLSKEKLIELFINLEN